MCVVQGSPSTKLINRTTDRDIIVKINRKSMTTERKTYYFSGDVILLCSAFISHL